jgi:hypothetical protein
LYTGLKAGVNENRLVLPRHTGHSRLSAYPIKVAEMEAVAEFDLVR